LHTLQNVGGGRRSRYMSAFKVVSDLICPWCYIGKRRLESVLHELPSAVDHSVSWHPFQLNPDMPKQGMNRKEYCMNKFGSWDRCLEMYAQIAAFGKTVGIDFQFQKQPTVPNTLDAHRVIWLAAREGAQDAVVERLFRAYFCEGVDLSIRSALVEVGAAAGLERKRLDQLLSSTEGVAEVLAEESEVKRLGITAVPLFIILDRVAVSGAQTPENLLKAWQQARASQQKRRKPVPAG